MKQIISDILTIIAKIRVFYNEYIKPVLMFLMLETFPLFLGFEDAYPIFLSYGIKYSDIRDRAKRMEIYELSYEGKRYIKHSLDFIGDNVYVEDINSEVLGDNIQRTLRALARRKTG